MIDNIEPESRTTTQRKTFRLQFVYTKLCYAFWHKLWNHAHIFFQIKVVLKVWIQFQRTKHAYWSSMTGRRRLSLQGTLSDSAELVAGDARHWGDGMNSSIGGNSLTKHFKSIHTEYNLLDDNNKKYKCNNPPNVGKHCYRIYILIRDK